MGLGDPDLLGDGGGVGSDAAPAAAVSCSICLEFVMDGGDRSTARLQCGHQFHLDCIGSAFNAKGAMQCPNCRKIEKGNWLYSNGYRSFPEFMDEWMHDDDFYDITYSEVPFGVHFCPFSRLARFPFSYEEGEYTSSIAHNDLLGHHALFAEYPGTSLYAHLCPYMGHVHPPPSSSSGSQVSNEGAAIDGPTFHHPWSNIMGPVDVPNTHAVPALDLHHQTWDSHTQPSTHVSGVEQASASSAARAVRLGSDAHPRQMYVPLLVGQGSGSRANNSATSSMVPHYVGNTRGHNRHEGHASYPRARGAANYFPDARRFGSSRGLAPAGPTPPAEHPSVYFFSPVAQPSSRNPQETEASGGSNLYAWERDRLAPFPLLPVDRDFPWWGPLPQTTAPSDSSSRPGFWPWHSSERPSSQPPPPHHPRLHPFI